MKPFSIHQIAGAVGAVWRGEAVTVAQVCTDTRALRPGCLFVALTGERFDGHHYIPQALEKGAGAVLSEQASEDPRVLTVKDTREALLSVAGLYRRAIAPRVVAVTGSVGKTTTKEMTACVLESAYKTHKTPANLNNEVGLAQTLLAMEEDTRAAVLELGVDGPGQMPSLARCAAPDVGVVTGVGITHLANFGSREELRWEKLAIRKGMPDGAVLLVCGDNDMLRDFADDRLRIFRYGFENPDNHVRALNLIMDAGQSRFDIAWEGARYSVLLPTVGVHNVINALAGFAAGVLLGVEPHRAASALGDYLPQGMRQRVVKHKRFTVVEDCYNAAPDSMRAALTTLGSMTGGRKIAVFSDMLELGEGEAEEHRNIGAFAASCGIDHLLCTGPLSEWYVKGASEAGFGQARHYPDQQALGETLEELVRPEDILWFKASRGMRLEQLLERIYSL